MKILFPYMARWYALNWSRYHSLLIALARQGHEVHVLQPPPLKSAETNFQEIPPVEQEGLYVHDVPLSPGLWTRRLPFDKLFKKAYFSLKSRGYARRLIKELGIDVVLLYNIPQYGFMSLPGVHVVFDYADDYLDMLRHELGSLSNPVAIALAGQMLDRMMRGAVLTTTVSNVLAQTASGNVVVVPNGVSAKECAVDEADSSTVATRRPVVGFVGSFEYFIDFDVILDMARRLPDIDVLLVGSGRDWQGVKNRVESEGLANVRLTGGVPHSEVFSYIGQMDICLNVFRKIPVSERACPIKLFEYLSLGKPTISTRLAELKWIDKDFLYYGDTGPEIVEQVRYILGHRGEAQERAERGRDHVMDQYTWERIADRFVSELHRAGVDVK